MAEIINDSDFIKGGADELAGKFKTLTTEIDNLTRKSIELFKVFQGQKFKAGEDLNKFNEASKKTRQVLDDVIIKQKERAKVEKQIATIIIQNTQIEETRLRLLEREKQVRTEANKSRKESVAISRAEKGSIERLRLETNKAIRSRDKMTVSTKKEAKEFRILTKRIRANQTQLKGLDAQIGRSQRNVGNYTQRIKGLGRSLAGAAGLAGGLFIVANAVKNAIGKFVLFDKANSKLSSILGATKKESAELSKTALQLGKSMVFTATQVVELQTELAKLGFESGEIVNAQRGILNLAAATGSDLAEAATISGAALRSFGLDAREMSRVTDVLALATSKSALDMSKLATALPTVASTAKVAGITIERTTALLGVLSDRGLDASTSATSLRNVFLELSKRGLTWERAMKKINLATDKNVASLELFGKRGATTGVILAENAESADDLTTALNGAAGAAERMAAVQLDNLSGDVTELSSAFEGLVLSVEKGDGAIAKFFRTSIQGLTDFVRKLSNVGKTLIEIEIESNADEAQKSVDSFLNNLKTSIKEQAIQNESFVKESNKRINEILDSDKELKKLEEKGDLQKEISDSFTNSLFKNSVIESKLTDDQIKKLLEIGNIQREIENSVRSRNELAKRGNLTTEEQTQQIQAQINFLEKKNAEDERGLEVKTALTAKQKLIETNATSIGLKLDKEDIDNLELKDRLAAARIGKRITEIKLLKEKIELEKESAEKALEAAKNQKIIDAEKKAERLKNQLAADSIAGLNKRISELNKLRNETSAQSPLLIAQRQEEIDKLKLQRDALISLGQASDAENDNDNRELEIKRILNEVRKSTIEGEIEEGEAVIQNADSRDQALDALEGVILRRSEILAQQAILDIEAANTEIENNEERAAALLLIEVNLQRDLEQVRRDGFVSFEKIQSDFKDTSINNSNEQADAVKAAAVKFNAIILDGLDQRFANQLEAARRETDLIDSNLLRLEAKRDRELENMASGNAARLDEIDAQIADEEAARDEAIRNEKEAQRRRQIISTLQQIANLALAATEVFASDSKAGAPGVAVAIIAIGAMLTAFAAFQASSASAVRSGDRDSGDGSVLSRGSREASGDKHSDPSGGIPLNELVDSTRIEDGQLVSILAASASNKDKGIMRSMTHMANSGGIDMMRFASAPTIHKTDFNIMYDNANMLIELKAIKDDQRKFINHMKSLPQYQDKNLTIRESGIVNSGKTRIN